jgi:hypothetical protein
VVGLYFRNTLIVELSRQVKKSITVIIDDYFIEEDPLVSIAVQNANKCTNLREAYDRLLQPLDPDGYIGKCFDILNGGNQSLFHPFDFIYSSAFAAVEEDDDFPIIAAMAAAVLSHQVYGDFVVRQHLNWNSHIKTLIREGLFKKIYRRKIIGKLFGKQHQPPNSIPNSSSSPSIKSLSFNAESDVMESMSPATFLIPSLLLSKISSKLTSTFLQKIYHEQKDPLCYHFGELIGVANARDQQMAFHLAHLMESLH